MFFPPGSCHFLFGILFASVHMTMLFRGRQKLEKERQRWGNQLQMPVRIVRTVILSSIPTATLAQGTGQRT